MKLISRRENSSVNLAARLTCTCLDTSSCFSRLNGYRVRTVVMGCIFYINLYVSEVGTYVLSSRTAGTVNKLSFRREEMASVLCYTNLSLSALTVNTYTVNDIMSVGGNCGAFNNNVYCRTAALVIAYLLLHSRAYAVRRSYAVFGIRICVYKVMVLNVKNLGILFSTLAALENFIAFAIAGGSNALNRRLSCGLVLACGYITVTILSENMSRKYSLVAKSNNTVAKKL